jgi:hypothetical protein
MTHDQRDNRVAAPFGGPAAERPRSLGSEPFLTTWPPRPSDFDAGFMGAFAVNGEDFFNKRSTFPTLE